ncbi:MAG TPA: alpha-L-rhamnosidase C-terminal domain-containing protein [Bacteroidota bacterium]|nr:alpha-L-rhamnosidase C-terminal domain-containing protein [Bacteroidota bacterium]
MPGLTRRDFFTWMALGVPAVLIEKHDGAGGPARPQAGALRLPSSPGTPKMLNLSPAGWIWYPSGRTLPNTFVFFRKQFTLKAPPRRASGWICADSRYLLHVNGNRVQWGPAPSDPRWMEVDPLEIAGELRAGENVIAATALYYGHGDGTSPAGKPGFIFRLDIETADGENMQIVSDASWLSLPARSWQPGHYKRWYVRSLQEDFDARLYPRGWESPEYSPGPGWARPMILPDSSPESTPIAAGYHEYALDLRGDPAQCGLRPRSIPLMRESIVPAGRLASSFFVTWSVRPEEYFDILTPGACTAAGGSPASESGERAWSVNLEEGKGSVLTFEFPQESIGWPSFTVNAPAGTTIELMVQEHHDPSKQVLINTHYNAWARFTCAEGLNHFETFDYEAVKWVQLHVRGTPGTVTVSDVALRRRTYAWSRRPDVTTGDAAINRLIGAAINTVDNSIHELAVDGMGRERQQYSGDGSHQLHAVYLAFGERAQPARFLRTFSQGITEEGFFLDCWPAYDRLARLWERAIGVSYWGPLVDHGIGFVFDCMHHYLYTGDRGALEEPFPRLLKFFTFLRSLRGGDGLLPVEHLGVPSVYIDHLAYKKQKHKQCAFNLYAAAMLTHALAPLCRTFGESAWEKEVLAFASEILARTREVFWDDDAGLYVANRPWAAEEGESRTCDRSLALGILYDLCPGGRSEKALAILADAPPSMGFSYPANACWRLWALAKGGRPDVILNDFRTRWAAMDSVAHNNTLQEFWIEKPDSGSVMSHSCPVPLYMMYMGIAGIQPLEPGFTRCMVRPQPGDLDHVALTSPTVRGDLRFASDGPKGARRVSVTMPPGCTGELTVDGRESLPLAACPSPGNERGLRRYTLPPGSVTEVTLRYT